MLTHVTAVIKGIMLCKLAHFHPCGPLPLGALAQVVKVDCFLIAPWCLATELALG